MVLLAGTWAIALAASGIILSGVQRGSGRIPLAICIGIVALCLHGLVFLPLDATDASERNRQEFSGQRFGGLYAEFRWKVVYFSTLLLGWVVAPCLFEYEASGGFSRFARVGVAWRRNRRYIGYYSIFLMILIASFAFGSGAFAWALCVAVSNAWGLAFAIILLSHGLLEIPAQLWKAAQPSRQLVALYSRVAAIDEDRLSGQFELHDLIQDAKAELDALDLNYSDIALEKAFRSLQATAEECEQLRSELTKGARVVQNSSGQNSVGVTPHGEGAVSNGPKIEHFSKLHHALKTAAVEAHRADCRWNSLVNECLRFEELREDMVPGDGFLDPLCQVLCCPSDVRSGQAGSHGPATVWRTMIRPRCYRVVSSLLGVFSGAIILDQITLWTESRSFSALAIVLSWCENGLSAQVACMLPLAYMAAAMMVSLFKFRFAGSCCLYSSRKTDICSLLWFVSILAKITPSLCYHFLLLLHVEGTALQDIMAPMTLVPFIGGSANQVFPIFAGWFVACHLLGVYPKFVRLCGLESTFGLVDEEFPVSGPAANDLIEEGRRLVERERRQRDVDRQGLEAIGENDCRTDSIPLRLQVAAFVADGMLPVDWNEASGQ